VIKLEIKPMSTNRAWKGKRFKTDEYKIFERSMLLILPKIKLTEAPYEVIYEFGYSNKANDIDNSIKQTTDILQKKYLFNDKEIYKMVVEKVIVPKGKEYIKFEIKTLTKKAQ
jgi:Holliday junction resolvase RusA-like endonuclease